jgi:hypothetical protein
MIKGNMLNQFLTRHIFYRLRIPMNIVYFSMTAAMR